MTLIKRRRIEAETLARVHKTLVRRLGKDQALAALEEILEAMALDAGKAYARTASGNPDLDHFAGVLDLWQGGGALEISDVQRTKTTLSFKVRRCAYAALYKEMNLPRELVERLSCNRDGPFCTGYSNKLTLTRTQTIASGAAYCDFSFHWRG